MRCLSLSMAAMALALLAACSTPTTRYHSLLPAAEPVIAGAPAAAAARAGWELLPVVVAVAVDRPQWVLQRSDGGFQLLEHERWLAPLPDELHAALSLHLARLLRAQAAPASPWRVALEVRRWDAALDRHSRLEALWTLSAQGQPARYCRAALQHGASGGIEGLAAAHRALVAQLAEALAATLRDPLKAC